MTKQEFDRMVESMMQSGLTKDNIMGVLIETFMEKKCDIDDLELMVGWLGYSLCDQFYEDNNIKRGKRRWAQNIVAPLI